MTWTTERPSRPGWYWWRYRDERNSICGIHHFDFDPGTEQLICTTSEESDTPEEMGGEWAGPLSPPEEPPT